ncbi:MAG: peptide deformylase [Bacteroidota bacterium]
MARNLRFYGDPVLRRKALPASEGSPDVAALVADLFDVMYREKGVGLAAPQVGESIRVFIVDVEDEVGRTKRAFVNPVITKREGTMVGEEGCLSIPGYREDVKRWAVIEVEAKDENGRPFTLAAEGLLARAIQHELDHLDGILFIDRLSPIKRKLLEARLKRFKAPVSAVATGAEGSASSL